MCFPGTWQWEGLQRSLRNVFKDSKRKRKNGNSNSATGLLFSRLPAQNVSGVSKQRRHHGPLQLHRKAEREQIPGRTETRGHCVYHHLSSHCGGKCHCFGGNMEEQKIPHTHVLLTGQLDALWFAFRLHLHGEHCDFWCKHSQIDSSSVVSSRRRRVYHTFCVYHQSPRYSHRAACHDGPDEAVSRAKRGRMFGLIAASWVSFGAPRHSLPIMGWNCIGNLDECSTVLPLLRKSFILFCITVFTLVLMSIVVLYVRIFRIVKFNTQRLGCSPQRKGLARKSQKYLALLKTVTIVLGVFIACWLPLFMLLLLDFCCPAQSCKVLYKADYFLGIAWSLTLNPHHLHLNSKTCGEPFWDWSAATVWYQKMDRWRSLACLSWT